ncbi:MOSC domain-containing protein, partial [Bradyrhizobium sp.]|uniref:MOSC domain-containing protein n=1 Tax=Bradyrhizobium sp. TaxID=376 RepID=UPI002732DD38
YLTARGRHDMLLYRPFFRDGERTLLPSNLAEAEALGPGVTPLHPSQEELALDVETPSGEVFGIDDPRLLNALGDDKSPASALTMRRSDRAFTDCRPVSMFSTQSVRTIEDAVGLAVDKRRFRANIYLDLASGEGFAEDRYVGRQLRIGGKVVIAVLERDIRCQMISLDPETAEANPEVLKYVARNHDGKAGIYAAVLVEGMVRAGDEVRLVE